MRYRKQRPAFSLLEMVLALALGMVLLLGLYFALNTYVLTANAGRDTLKEGELARSVMLRITNDLNGHLGPYDPRVAAAQAAAAANSSTTSSSSSATNPNSSTSGSGAPVPFVSANVATGGATLNVSNTDMQSDGPLPVLFNVGVYGNSTSLVLSIYRVRPSPPGAATDSPDPVVTSDLRRVSYWMVSNGADPVGLARQEVPQGTSLDADVIDPTQIADQNSCIIAKEVKNILFEYFDGQTWQESWDGTVTTPENSTPIGPPVAIRVTMTLRRGAQTADSATTGPADGSQDLQFVQIIAIPGANNPVPNTPAASSSP